MATLRSIEPPPYRPAHRPVLAADPPDQRWDLLLLCVTAHILMAVGRFHQLFPALDVLRPALLTGLVGIVIYLFDRSEARRLGGLVRQPTTKYLLAFLFWMMLSLPGALVRGDSVDLVFDGFLKTVVMFLLVAGAVRGIRDVERLAIAYLVSATVYAVVVVTRFDLGAGEDWRLGRLYYYDANDLATFLVTAVPLGLYFLHAGRTVMARVLAIASLAALTVAFVYTGSRGGFIALAAMAGYIVLRYSAISFHRRAAATVLVALIVAGTASDRYWEQMGTIMSDTDYNRSDETGRMRIWRRGIGYMLQNPLFGVGPRNFQTAEGTLSELAERQQFGVGVQWNAAHNTFIQVGAELGIVGLAVFLGLLASAFRALRRSRPRERTPAARQDRRTQLTQVITASLIGFVVGAFFLSLAYAEMLYALIAMAVGLHKVAVLEGAQPAAASEQRLGSRREPAPASEFAGPPPVRTGSVHRRRA